MVTEQIEAEGATLLIYETKNIYEEKLKEGQIALITNKESENNNDNQYKFRTQKEPSLIHSRKKIANWEDLQ